MNSRLAVKLTIDLGLTAAMLAAFAYHLTGPAAHEWIGLTMFILLTAHNALNWRWYRNIGRTGAGIQARLSLAVTITLLAVTGTLLISSLMVSRELFPFIRAGNGFQMRQFHTLAAYWILVIMSVHVGLHWNLIISVGRRLFRASRPGRLRAALLRLAGAAVMGLGLWASFDRGLGSKLLMRHSFDYWAGSTAGFFITYLSIMGLYIGLTYYSLLWFKHRQSASQKKQPWKPAHGKLTARI